MVRSILSELLIAFQTFSQNKRGDENGSESTKNLLTANDISELRNDMKIQRILEKTLEINFVELKSLNEFETLMFFFNLLNLMMCHCYLCLKLDKSDGVYSKYSFFRDVSYASLGYNVGELGFMSIIDIKQKILGENLSPGFSPRSNDKWSRLQLQLYPDPRLMFAIINFRSSSPPLFLVNFDNYDTQIEGAITNYVEAFVSVEDNQLVISDLLERYLNNVISNQDTNNIILSGKDIPNKIQLLLKFLVDHSRNELHDHLSNLLPTGNVLSYK